MKIKLFTVVLLWFNAIMLLAQVSPRIIKGKVTDETGKPLEGVSIILRNTKTGTVTEADGTFVLKTAATGKLTLTVTSTGYAPQTVNTEGNEPVKVALIKAYEKVEDVVVIGYQTVRRRDLLASVSSVSAKDLRDIPVASAAEAIQGKLAGVQVTTAEGSPDADIKIRVRGGGSITQDNSPLYVIDGVQVENGLSTISPQDIQTIDVLKDAAATAIYGARGANGVIIITTKSGKFNNKLTVSYNGFYGIKNLTKELKVLSPYDMVMWEYERTRPYNTGGTTDSATFAQRYGTTWDTLSVYKKVPAVDWQKLVLGNTGTTQTHNVTVSGGTKYTTYELSYTRNDEKAIVQNSSFLRNNVLVRIDHKSPNDKLKIGIAARFTDQAIKGAGVSSPNNGSSYNRLRNAVKYRPFLSNGISTDEIDPSLVDNTVGNGLSLVNPVVLNNAEYRKRTTDGLNLTGYASYQITKNLSFKSTVGIDNSTYIDRVFEDSIVPFVVTSYASKPFVELDTVTREILTNSNVLTYSLKGLNGKHDIDILLGEEMYRLVADTALNQFRNFPTFTTPDAAFNSPTTLGTYVSSYPKLIRTEYVSLSYFGRISYNYLGKYLFSANLRADGASKFASGKRWGYFPSGSFAWRLSKEKFMDNVKFVNDLKLRLGYGVVGNNRIGDYLFIQTFNPSTYYYLINGQTVYGYSSASLVSPNLKWETTTSRNIGVDMTFLKNRLTLSVDYYNNTTKDLLINTPIASTYGYASQLQNVGSTANSGVEVQLSANIIQNKSFSWNANFNIAFNQNKIKSLASGQNSYLAYGYTGVSGQPADYIVKVGEPVGAMYGFVTDGFYKVSDFDYNALTQRYTLKSGVVNDGGVIGTSNSNFTSPQPGMLKLKDLNGDGVVDANNDRTILGNATPKFTGGLNQQFVWKNFDASIFLNFVYGNKIYNANKIEFSNGYTPNSNLLAIMKDRWRTVDDNGQVVTDPAALTALNANAKIWRPLTSSGAFYLHSWAVEDGSFLRINNVTIGYSIKPSKLKGLNITRLRFYATVNNLAVFTKYSGYDPEVNVRYNNPVTPGLDYSAYPKSRTILFGVNVSFQ